MTITVRVFHYLGYDVFGFSHRVPLHSKWRQYGQDPAFLTYVERPA